MADSETTPINVSDVTCSLCLEQYQDPRVLACLHTYCRHCLESLVEHSKECTVSCPQCREKIEISVEEVKSLKVDFMLIDLIEKMSVDQENKGDISITCETCQSDVATGRCDDCCEFMCEFCITCHRRLLRTKQHKIKGIKEVKGTLSCKSHYCPHHRVEKLTLFCDTCDELICRDCVIKAHQTHKYDFTSNIIDREKELIKDKIEEVKSKQVDLSQVQANVLSEKARIEAQRKSLTSEIDEFIDAKVSLLEEMRSNLKDEVFSDYEKRNKQLDSQENHLSIFNSNCNSCVKFAERVCQAGPGNEVEVLSLKREVLSRLSDLANTTIQDVLFERMLNTLKVDEYFWKSVTEKASLKSEVIVDPKQCVVTMGKDSEPGIIYSTFAQQLIPFSVAVNDSKKKCYCAQVSVEAYVRKTSPKQDKVTPLIVEKPQYYCFPNYEFKYMPPDDGDYELSVKVNGENVRGSPFKWSVRPESDLVKMFEKPSKSLLLLKKEHVAWRVKLLRASSDSELGVDHKSSEGRQIWGQSWMEKLMANEPNYFIYYKGYEWKDGDVFGVYLSRDGQNARMIINNERTERRNIFSGINFPVCLYTHGEWYPQFGK
ncbi:tripartite motif-containing protein 45 [Nematostella vectensis]|uniref:tripartite motif-containing protein 45 n=1 Tax=Nematostella vectensis TaxID=45351 RepID=UPI0020771957|nr:tripartite motif-containing protein 45 [Nematostella vectensis]